MTWGRIWDNVDNVPEKVAARVAPSEAGVGTSETVVASRVEALVLPGSTLACAPTFGQALAAALYTDKPVSMTWKAFQQQLGVCSSLLQRYKAGDHLSLRSADDLARKRGWLITISRE